MLSVYLQNDLSLEKNIKSPSLSFFVFKIATYQKMATISKIMRNEFWYSSMSNTILRSPLGDRTASFEGINSGCKTAAKSEKNVCGLVRSPETSFWTRDELKP